MDIVKDLYFCIDCTFMQLYDSVDDIDECRETEIREGLNKVIKENEAVPSLNDKGNGGVIDFTNKACDCCETTLAGARIRLAIVK